MLAAFFPGHLPSFKKIVLSPRVLTRLYCYICQSSFGMSQPDDVGINEILFLLTSQETYRKSSAASVKSPWTFSRVCFHSGDRGPGASQNRPLMRILLRIAVVSSSGSADLKGERHMPAIPSVILNNGVKMLLLGFGVF